MPGAFVIVASAIVLVAVLVVLGQRRQRQRVAHIESFQWPDGVARRVRQRYPHLGDAELDLVLAGLRQYFRIALDARRRRLAMPSQVVDAAWHEFILFTRGYEVFCRRAFGRFLHHTPAEAMRSPQEAQEGIRRAWRLACAQEGIAPRAPDRLPLIFALDDRLHIPDGFRYALNCAAALTAAGVAGSVTYCASHIGCGSGGGDGGCSSDSGCSGDGGGCGGGD